MTLPWSYSVTTASNFRGSYRGKHRRVQLQWSVGLTLNFTNRSFRDSVSVTPLSSLGYACSLPAPLPECHASRQRTNTYDYTSNSTEEMQNSVSFNKKRQGKGIWLDFFSWMFNSCLTFLHKKSFFWRQLSKFALGNVVCLSVKHWVTGYCFITPKGDSKDKKKEPCEVIVNV